MTLWVKASVKVDFNGFDNTFDFFNKIKDGKITLQEAKTIKLITN